MVIAAFQRGREKCTETSAATPKKLLPYLRPLDLPRVELSVSSCHAIITLAQLLAHTHTYAHDRAYDQTILPIKLFLLISKLILLFLFGRMIQTSAPPNCAVCPVPISNLVKRSQVLEQITDSVVPGTVAEPEAYSYN